MDYPPTRRRRPARAHPAAPQLGGAPRLAARSGLQTDPARARGVTVVRAGAPDPLRSAICQNRAPVIAGDHASDRTRRPSTPTAQEIAMTTSPLARALRRGGAVLLILAGVHCGSSSTPPPANQPQAAVIGALTSALHGRL